MTGLTPRQKECLDYICLFIDTHHYPPTTREIGEHMGIGSTNGICDHLTRLVRKGYITKSSNVARGITVLRRDSAQPSDSAGERLSKIAVLWREYLAASDDRFEREVLQRRLFAELDAIAGIEGSR